MKNNIWLVVACCGLISFCLLNLWGLAEAREYKQSQIITPVHYTSSNRTLKDANGKKMGSIKGDKVYNANNKLIGYVRSSGTTTASGKTVSKSQLPGLLFCK